MAKADVYTRNISSEEARESYILVLKNRLSFFGGVGASFALVQGGNTAPAKVESYDCTCVGPDKPHQHYFIRRPGLKRGDRVQIARTSPGRYELAVLSAWLDQGVGEG